MLFLAFLNSKLLKIIHFLPKIYEKVYFLNIFKQKLREKVRFLNIFKQKYLKKAKNDNLLLIFNPKTDKIDVFLLEKLHF